MENIMKEKIYEIPVNDAFDQDCECPLCAMRKVLEDNAVEYTMGPSYMEDDIRAKTDEAGFCEKHLLAVYHCDNRLGISMVLKTHFDKVIDDIRKRTVTPIRPKSLFRKEEPENPVVSYIDELNGKCFVCERVNQVFDRYLNTCFYLWKSDQNFRDKFNHSKGFCTTHYRDLLKMASGQLKGDSLDQFVKELNELYLTNMERVRDDLAWFINKFDYKYANESWKNAKDAVPRAMMKDNSCYYSAAQSEEDK